MTLQVFSPSLQGVFAFSFFFLKKKTVFLKFFKKLFIYFGRHWVLVVVQRIFVCGARA